LAKFERELIRERTNAGLKAARARGRNGGRPKSLSEADEKMVKKLMDDKTIPINDICKQFGISRSTLYKYFPQN
jgi:DNA invertase Pin-like site-specific DNA recombinase